MSLSNFFNRKSRTAVVAATLVLGGAGGYAGYQVAENHFKPQLSEFTLSNAPQGMTDTQFMAGKIPAGMTTSKTGDQDESAARLSFTQQIDVMAGEQRQFIELVGPIIQGRIMPELPMGDMEARAHELHAALYNHAVSFVTDLRTDENLSGKDYKALLDDYNARVGLDVTALTGNYKTGIAFNQACQFAGDLGNMFGRSSDDVSAGQRSADAGACMQGLEKTSDGLAMGGAAGGALLGGLFALPLWRRRRDTPQVFKSKKPAA